jgi:hypothetical protein
MNLLWTYYDMLNDAENDGRVLDILTDVLECDMFFKDTMDKHLEAIKELKFIGEEKIYEEILSILTDRKNKM